MNLSVRGITKREKDDPEYADFWLDIVHLDTHVGWEVPLTNDELNKIKRYLPKKVQEQIKELEAQQK